AGLRINTPDPCTVGLGGHAALGDVAIRTDTDIQILAIGTGRHGLGPVMVDLRWQGRHGFRWPTGSSLPGLVTKANDSVLIGDVKVVADQREAIRGIQSF